MQDIEHLGKYEIIAEIGRGGFGIVYKAWDTTLERTVALKALAPHHSWDPEFVRRFYQEAKAVARLRHPHIVTVHEVGDEDGQVYMAMEHIPGQTLTDMLTADGRLTPEQIVDILTQLAAALDYAHSQGMLHRDINPNNIMVEVDGQGQLHTTLMDFGLVKILEGSQYVKSTTRVMGTPDYMSPEQADGQALDFRSDLYALGVVAYRMCTGQVPFSASSPLVIMRWHLDKVPPSPRALNPELPEKVDAVLLRALHKEPGARYQRAGELAIELKRAFGLALEPKPLTRIIPPDQPFEPELILIPAGEFLMGSDPAKDSEAYEEEFPQHTVYLSDYYIAKTPVTNAQYWDFVAATSHKAPEDWEDGKIPYGKSDHPVANMDWDDAVAYCRWLAEVTGKPYRLPTEAEWEKAARGTDGRIYP
ncbi:MAG: SUMF1/EgtB/PvdO family nonheme iron enzyme, partial [Anaerolineae bacterium]|nr:SUMF1/EgtB/PvdO family nonheme iron enzyme [Anaerolineae bacterium]